MCSMASIKAGGVLATLVPSMTEKTVAYGLEQVQPAAIISESDLLPKILNILKVNDQLQSKVVCMDKSDASVDYGLEVIDLSDLEVAEQEIRDQLPTRLATDTAVIMYTSGTSSKAKGVVFTHENIIEEAANITGQLDHKGALTSQPPFSTLSYLPSSHIFEFTLQYCMMGFGACIHFGSSLTLTDNSPVVVAGQPGDITLTKPYFIIGVPLVLSKFKAAVRRMSVPKSLLSKGSFSFVSITN